MDRFRRSALLNYPIGHHARPTPALLNAVYLWGAHFLRRNPPSGWTPSVFLTRAANQIFQDLGGRHPRKVLHGIQAQVLISLYMLNTGRPIEGTYHSSASVSLAIRLVDIFSRSSRVTDILLIFFSSEFHLIRSSRRSQSRDVGMIEQGALSPPADNIDEGERINAFWTVLVINNYWVIAHGSPSAISYDMPIDTPWPLEMSEYTIARVLLNLLIMCTYLFLSSESAIRRSKLSND